MNLYTRIKQARYNIQIEQPKSDTKINTLIKSPTKIKGKKDKQRIEGWGIPAPSDLSC